MPHLRPGDKFKLNRMTEDNKPVILHCQITRAIQTHIVIGEAHEFTFIVNNITSAALLTHTHGTSRVVDDPCKTRWSGHKQ